MTEHDEFFSEHDDSAIDDEIVEAYCFNCRGKHEMLNPAPVWTSQGRPGTRGDCANCGGTVYIMGYTPAHDAFAQPEAINVVDNRGLKRNSRAAKIKIEAATYIVSAATDSDFAEKLSHDLNSFGISTWVDNGERADNVNWAGEVHPALDQCKKLVVIMSEFAPKTAHVTEAWEYFKRKRKPIFIIMISDLEPPDDLRRRPRFEMGTDYKAGFRQLVQELSQ